jgi:hypothetical protein
VIPFVVEKLLHAVQLSWLVATETVENVLKGQF